MQHLSPELIEKLDKLADSPNVCASRVYNAIKESHPDLTQYDLYCFAVEMLGAGVVNGELKYAEGSIKLTARDFYYAHYLRVSECVTSEAAGQPTESITKPGITDGSKKHLRLL